MATQTPRESASSPLDAARFPSSPERAPERAMSTQPGSYALPRERWALAGEQCEANR